MITLVRQPEKSKLCGQTCVAMLLGITVDEAIKLVGKKGATNLKHLLPPLKSRYKFVYPSERLQTVTVMCSIFRQIPQLGFVRVRWNKTKGHWVLGYKGKILDPDFGEQDVYEFHERVTRMGGRITSYYDLIDKRKN